VLVRLGHNITILERSTPSSLLDQGAGINVAPYIPPITASLNQLGISSPIFEFFKEYDRTGKPWCISTDEVTLQILRRDGGVKAAPSVKGMLLGATSWELLHNILRANFDGKFENGFIDEAEKKSSDGNAKYLHGMQVNSLVDLGAEGVAIECMDTEGKKTSMTANLVIGADGPSSTMRSLFLPEITRDIVGYVAWRGTATLDLLSASTRESLRYPAFFYSRGNQAVQ
jgi:2-polyprenyl-6-methoxyphenol hydroxylase-like FAD-dependent oxidoreductase